MKKIIKMRKTELDFKEFINSSSVDFSNKAYELQELDHIIKNSDVKYQHLRKYYASDYDSVLTEESYFENTQNIAALQHFRYMPAAYHEHEFFELAYILSGTLTNHILDNKLTLHSGDVMILAPHTRHAASTFSDDGIIINILVRTSTFERHFMNLLPDNDLLKNFFVNILYHNSSTPYLLFRTGNDMELTDYILKILSETNSHRQYRNTLLQAYTSVFLAILLRNHEKDISFPYSNSAMANENTVYILQYMQKNYNTITLNDLAKFFNYSERQVQRIIRNATNLSFRDNILKLRMSHAAELLTTSNLTVSDIAAAVGYYDASNFRHLFKKYFGMTPLQYQTSHLKES